MYQINKILRKIFTTNCLACVLYIAVTPLYASLAILTCIASHPLAASQLESTAYVESITDGPCSGIVYIKFNGNDDYLLHIRSYTEAPDFISEEFFDILEDDNAVLYPFKGGEVCPLPLCEEYFNQSNIIVIERVISGKGSRFGYLELLRQSEKDLMKLYNFYKPGGYTILGRNTVDFPCPSKINWSQYYVSRPFSRPIPDLTKYYSDCCELPEVEESIALVKLIWDGPVKLGPNNNNGPRTQCPLIRLDLLKNGSWSTSCGDISYIFVNLAAASNAIPQARFIGAYQRGPFWKDLVLHSHAIAEFYSKSIDKWVLIDPWFGALFMKDGNYLNSQDIVAMDVEQRMEIEIVNFIETPLPFPFNPTAKECPIGSYWNYFGSITIGPTEKM